MNRSLPNRRCRSAASAVARRAPGRPSLLTALLLLATLQRLNAGPLPTVPGLKRLDAIEGVSSYLLPNGLQVLLVPAPAQSTLTVHITYRVGSRHEGAGESGMAHLLEHMLFKGSSRHRDPLTEYEQHGAVYNAETDHDYTAYYETLLATPENLRFALDLEADRMATARLERSDLEKEFSVVQNELELGENAPEQLLHQRLLRAAYSWHSYGRDVIGSRSDIEGVPIERLRLFYRSYYQPDNAVLIVAGRFEPEPTLRQIATLFGRLPRPLRRLPPTYTVEPVQDGERMVTLRRAGDVPLVGLLYHGLAVTDPDYVAAEAALDSLTHVGSGRAYHALVESHLASGLHGEVSANREPGTVALFAEVGPGQAVEAVRDKLIATVEELGRKALSAVELRRFASRRRREFVRTSAEPEALAAELGHFAALGDWRLRYLHRDRVEQLTPEAVQRFAARYFVAANRTVGLFLPTAEPLRSPKAATLTDAELALQLQGYRGRPAPVAGEPFAATVDNIESRLQRLTLPNGMKVALLAKKSRGETVHLVLQVAAGSAEAVRGKGGLLELVGPMLERGTRRRTFLELRDELDNLGAELQAPQPSPLPIPSLHQKLSIETGREHVAEVLTLLAELVEEPSFPSEQLELVRRAQQTAIERARQEPLQLAGTALLRRLYPYPADDARYIPTLRERLARLSSVKVEELRQFHRDYFGGGASQLAVVGDFDPAQVRRALEVAFAAWRAPRAYERLIVPYVPSSAATETLRVADKSSAVGMAAQSLELRDSDPDFPALQLFGFLLGGHDNARLKLRLREESGASYEVAASVSAQVEDRSGLLFAYFTCAPKNAVATMARLEAELADLVAHGVGQAELQATQLAYRKLYEVELASDSGLAAALVETLEHGRTLRFAEGELKKVLALTPAELHAAIRRHIAPARRVLVLAGDLVDGNRKKDSHDHDR